MGSYYIASKRSQTGHIYDSLHERFWEDGSCHSRYLKYLGKPGTYSLEGLEIGARVGAAGKAIPKAEIGARVGAAGKAIPKAEIGARVGGVPKGKVKFGWGKGWIWF